jgi:alkylation response protein AidB-like acyl-CoA dehydrogenase
LIAFDWLTGAAGVYVASSGRVATGPVTVRTLGRIDLLHPVAYVEPVRIETPEKSEGLQRAIAFTRMGFAAALTGVASSALKEAVAYAKERQQFGRPIAEFQAIQHLCAEMLVDVEACRSITYGGAWVAQNESIVDANRVSAAAKSWCGNAAIRVCEKGIQVLGGIGVTWEHTAHMRLRTAQVFARAFGNPDAMAAQLALDAARVLQKAG